MAKKIILLNRSRSENEIELSYVFWLDVPEAQREIYAGRVSQSKYAGATAEENALLASGAVLEDFRVSAWAIGTTATTIRQSLVASYNAAQAALSAINRRQYYGAYWDGTSWQQA